MDDKLKVLFVIDIQNDKYINLVVKGKNIIKVGKVSDVKVSRYDAVKISEWFHEVDGPFAEATDSSDLAGTLVKRKDCVICKPENLEILMNYFLGKKGL